MVTPIGNNNKNTFLHENSFSVLTDELNVSDIDNVYLYSHHVNVNTNKKHRSVRRGRRRKSEVPKNNVNKINIAFNNVRGCKSKLYEIEKLCHDKSIKIFGLAETFLKNEELLHIQDYKWIGKGRSGSEKKGGGGVGFLVKDDITILDDNFVNSKCDDFERIWIKVGYNQNSVYCAVAYFPVEGTNLALTEELHNQILSEVIQINDLEDDPQIVILGDFNGKIGNYISNGDPLINKNGQALINFSNDSGLIILNSTRLCSGRFTWFRNDKQSILDYILVSYSALDNVNNMLIDDERVYNLGSDHNLLFLNFELKYKLNKQKLSNNKLCWDIKPNHDFTAFKEKTKDVFQDFVINDDDNSDTIWYNWKERLLRAAKDSIGVKTYNGNKKPWYDSDIDQAIDVRRQSNQRHRQYVKTGGNNKDVRDNLWEDYRSNQKLVKKLIREKAMQKRIDKCIEINRRGGKSCKDFWSILRGPKQKDNLCSLKIPNTDVITNDIHVIKDSVYHYWNTLGKMSLNLSGDEIFETKEMLSRLKSNTNNTNDNDKPILDQVYISRGDIIDAISLSKNNKSPGLDNITNELIKNWDDSVTDTLFTMFQRFALSESTPRDWNTGIIIPIHKKGDKADLNNYRGITLNSCISKIYTRIITKHVSTFVENNGILSEIQGGFRADRRCEDHIFTLKSIASIRKMEGKSTYLAFLDFKKAFDSVWRDKLLVTAWEIGIRGNIFNIISNMYNNVHGKVHFGDIHTDTFDIDEGLKQGCVLSPILFCIYINELARGIRDKNIGAHIYGVQIGCLFWADDVVLIGDTEKDLNALLNAASEFSNKYKLNFNYEKSNVVVIGKKLNEDKPWKLGRSVIKETNAYKYLGVNIGRNLSDHVHIEEVIHKGNRLIAYIKSLINNQDDFNRVYYGDLLWKTIGLPCINYACSVWVCSESDTKRIEGLQLQMARSILRACRNTAKEALYGELGWDSVSSIQDRHRIKYFNRLLNMENDRWPKLLLNAFFLTSSNHSRNMHAQWKWLTHIHDTLTFCGLDHMFSINRPINKNWAESFINIQHELNNNDWYEKALTKKTLRDYCKYKSVPNMEKYLLDATDFYGCALKFKARTNTLQLEYNIKSWSSNGNSGICKLCKVNLIEDTDHFMFSCTSLNVIRDQVFITLCDNLCAKNLHIFWEFFNSDDNDMKHFLMLENLYDFDYTLGEIFDKCCKTYIKNAWKHRAHLLNNPGN